MSVASANILTHERMGEAMVAVARRVAPNAVWGRDDLRQEAWLLLLPRLGMPWPTVIRWTAKDLWRRAWRHVYDRKGKSRPGGRAIGTAGMSRRELPTEPECPASHNPLTATAEHEAAQHADLILTRKIATVTSPQQKQVMLLLLSGMTRAEVATKLGMTRNDIEVRVCQARKRLDQFAIITEIAA